MRALTAGATPTELKFLIPGNRYPQNHLSSILGETQMDFLKSVQVQQNICCIVVWAASGLQNEEDPRKTKLDSAGGLIEKTSIWLGEAIRNEYN